MIVFEAPGGERVELDPPMREIYVTTVVLRFGVPFRRQIGSPVPVDFPLVELTESRCFEIIAAAYEEALLD